MKVILCGGDGETAQALVGALMKEGHILTLVDRDPDVLAQVSAQWDILTVTGNCACLDTLKTAEVKKADLLIACTQSDEANLLTCTVAHNENPKLHTIARIHNPEYVEQSYAMQDLFGLSLIFNPEHQAALEAEKLIKYPGFLQRETFAGGRAEIAELLVDRKNLLCGQSLRSLSAVTGCRILVLTVIRDGKAITPGADFVVQENDRLFLTASTDDLTTLLKNAGVTQKRSKRIMIMGGGRFAYYLAQLLTTGRTKMDVTLLEKDEKTAEEVAEALPRVKVLHSSADRTTLEQEGISDCGAFASLTGEDDRNIILSLYAREKGVPLIITRLGEFANSDMAEELPLGNVIAPATLCCDMLVRYIRALSKKTGTALSLHTFAEGHGLAVEFAVDKKTPHINTPLKNIKLKEGVRIAGITHGRTIEIPGADSFYNVGDTLIFALSEMDEAPNCQDLFQD